MTGSIWLHSDRLSVEVRPDKGADITSITDRATGIDILFHAPWDRPDLTTAPTTGDSQFDWLARYGGGWQQLIPNAGAARVVEGVERGYHGEAAIVPWSIQTADDAHAALTIDLASAPLRLTRSVQLDRETVRIADSIHNTSDESVAVM